MKGKVLITDENGLHFTCSDSQLLARQNNLQIIQEKQILVESTDFKVLEINSAGEIKLECFVKKKIGETLVMFEKKFVKFCP